MKKKNLFYLSFYLFIFLFVFSDVSYCGKTKDDSWDFWNRGYVKILKSLVDNNKTVVLAVIGGGFNCQVQLVPEKDRREEFLVRYAHKRLNDITIALVNAQYFSSKPNFAVVDRDSVEMLLNEHKFQQTGFITKNMRSQLGEMLGITHILIVSGGRSTQVGKPEGYIYTDEDVFKLIDISLGKILSIENVMTHRIGNRYTLRTKEYTESTNIRDYKFE